MAYIDVLSPDAYGRFNRKLAQLSSLATAVYWSELLDISTKVVKKQKFDKDGFFKLDRKYITERTTIELEGQLDADQVLQNIGILEVNPEDLNKIRVNLEVAISILSDDSFKLNKTAKKKVGLSKAQASEAKRNGIIITMKQLLSEPDLELHEKYENWVDSVYAGKRFLTKAIIQTFENKLNNYTSSRQVKSDFLDMAIACGYSNFDWVKSTYERSYGKPAAEQKISDGAVRQDIIF